MTVPEKLDNSSQKQYFLRDFWFPVPDMIIEFYFCVLYQKRKIQFCRFKLWSLVCPFILKSSQCFYTTAPSRSLKERWCPVIKLKKSRLWPWLHFLGSPFRRIRHKSHFTIFWLFVLVSSLTMSYFKCKIPHMLTWSLWVSVIPSSWMLLVSRVTCIPLSPCQAGVWNRVALPRVRTWPLRNKGRKRGLWTWNDSPHHEV